MNYLLSIQILLQYLCMIVLPLPQYNGQRKMLQVLEVQQNVKTKIKQFGHLLPNTPQIMS